MSIFFERREGSVSVFEGSGMNFPPHLHQHVELLYLLEGRLQVFTNGRWRSLQAGEVYVSFPNTVHEYRTVEENRYLMVIFHPEQIPYFQRKLTDWLCSEPFITGVAPESEIGQAFARVTVEARREPKEQDVLAAYLNLLAALLLRHFTLIPRTDYREEEWFPRLLEYLSCSFTQEISLEKLAREMGVSSWHLSRVFSERVGYTIPQYLHQLRVGQAAQPLLSTRDTVTDICFACGYKNIRSFNRAFRQMMGCTPSAFRIKSRQPAAQNEGTLLPENQSPRPF